MFSLKGSAYRLLLAALLFTGAACNPVSKYIHSSEVLRWEPDIRVFDSLNRIEKADEHTLLFAGSSSIRLWDGIHSDMEPYKVIQRGYGGAKLNDFNYYAVRIINPGTYKAIVIFVANDITGGENDRTPREVLQLFKTLVYQLRERNPDTPVFWIETTPTPSRWQAIKEIRKANELIRQFCEQNSDLHFIGTCNAYLTGGGLPDSTYFRNDMLHQNLKGYALWSDMIKNGLKEGGVIP